MRAVYNEDCQSAVFALSKILKKIRPINVQEIQRLVRKAELTAALISQQDIVLLVGVTGSGKSTTIQFLTGTKMKNTLIEIAPTKFLEHISIEGPITNPTLANVLTSPLSNSTTQFLSPVTVQLKDLFGRYETGEIILCDAPAFDDTSGAEVDIANTFRVIQALKSCKSVKILALSRCRSLGDKGQGIQTLIRVLINMIPDIEDRLDAILYGFTKYPPQTDIHAFLADLKTSKVDEDPQLRLDDSFVTVLTDMINKTKVSAERINPVGDDPRNLVQKLRSLRGICYPEEVLRFSISEETKAKVEQQIHQYRLSIMRATKQKDFTLVTYYLDHFKMLREWMKQDFVEEAYGDSKRVLSDYTEDYCKDVIEKLSRILASHDRLTEENIKEYTNAYHYLEQIGNLRAHFGSNIVSVELFTGQILSQLENRKNLVLNEGALYNPSIGTYLDNFHLLRKSFTQLDSAYKKTCDEFDQRFELEFGESLLQLISANEFQRLAEIMLQISNCVPILNHHLNGKVEKKYYDTVTSVLQYLENISGKANALLARITLHQDDIGLLQQYLCILRSAKDATALGDRLLKNRNTKHLIDEIYRESVKKVIQYFDETSSRIKHLLEKNKHYALEIVEPFVRQLELIRTTPEIESKTARTFWHLIDDLYASLQQLQRDTEQLFHTLDFQSGTVSIRPLARSLARLKSTQWIDRIYPGTSDVIMRPIREELIEYAEELEQRMMKVDLSVKSPQNIRFEQEILDRIELMSSLKNSIPEMQNYRHRANQFFLAKTQTVLSQIQNLFSLPDNAVAQLRQEVIDLEQIKVAYDHFYPHLLHLHGCGYSSISKVNDEIEQLKTRHTIELNETASEKNRLESELNDLQSIIPNCEHSTPPTSVRNLIGRMIDKISTGYQRSETQLNERLRQKEYSSIGVVHETTVHLQEDLDEVAKLIEFKQTHFSRCLMHLESIKETYLSLLGSRDFSSPKEIDFLNEKQQSSYESLKAAIEDKKSRAIQYEIDKQLYYFREKLDAGTANNALMYVNNCEDVIVECAVKDIALRTKEVLQTYLREYASFLDREIERSFKRIIKSNGKDLFPYCLELEKRFHEFSSLEKYSLVFECFNGTEKIEYWHRQFRYYYRFLHHRLEECRISARNEQLQHLILVTEALSCLDHFSIDGLTENRFHELYRQYRLERTKMSAEISQIVIDYLSKGDYSGANLNLTEVLGNSPHSKSITQMKYHLHRSLHTLMKQTKIGVYSLDGRIEREDNHRHQLREIIENIDTLRLILHQSDLVRLIDEQTKTDLRHFDKDIKRILSNIILKGIHSIELSIDLNRFLEAEKSMKNLHRVWCELPDHWTSVYVHKEIEEIKRRLYHLPSDIEQRYDFVDIEKFSKDSPKDLLEQLKRVLSGGFSRYSQLLISLREKLRRQFDHAIDEAHHYTLNDRIVKTRTIKYAFHFLPDDLKLLFQSRIDELNHLNRNIERVLEFD